MTIPLTGLTLAQQAAPPGGPAAAPSFRPIILMFVAIGLLFYFIILRPQKSDQKKRQSMLDEVAKGDHIVSIGGLHGTVEAVDLSKGILSVSIAPKTTVRINKSALASVTPKGKDKDKDKASKDKKS